MTDEVQHPGTEDPQEGPDIVEDDGVLDLDEAKEVIPYNFEMTAYGADYPVDALIARLSNGDLRIPTFGWEDPDNPDRVGFQRGFVWSKPQSDKFIESLLLGLPVPGIFLVKESSGVLLVLDGHQRLRTLSSFYEGVIHGREYKLNKVQDRYSGLRYKDLAPENRRRLDNSIIHATVVRQDQPKDDDSSVYQIFERLNSGGTVLQPQEIRIALYSGRFVALLNELNERTAWRELYGNLSRRLKDIELILRFLGMYFHAAQYKRPMKGFLNSYMSSNRDLEKQDSDLIEPLFDSTVQTILDRIGDRAFKPKTAINAAVLDSLMVGVARRLEAGPITDTQDAKAAYDALMADEEYVNATSRATADDEQVKTRLEKSTSAFASVT